MLPNLIIVDTVADDLDGELNHIKTLCDENGFSTVIVEPRKGFYDLTRLKKLSQELHIEIVVGERIASWHDCPGTPEAPAINDVQTPGVESIDNFIALHRPEFYKPRCRN